MRRRMALRGLRCALAAVSAAAVAVSGVTGLAAAEAAPQPLTAAQVIELARQAAAGATGPGVPASVGVGSRSAPSAAPALHGEGDVDAGAGGRVEADPVEVSFSGSAADDVHVAIDGLRSGPLPAAGGLPAGAVEVGPAFEVTARTGTGTSVLSFPTTYDVAHSAAGVDVATDVVPGVTVTVGIDGADLAGIDPATVRLYSRESDDEPWSLVASYLDEAAGAVRGELDHLSQFVVIGIPFQADPGPVVVLDPDDDMANTDSPDGHVTELPFNYALAVAVAQQLVTYCGATVVLTRGDDTPVVSQETRAGIAAAADPALTMTLAFNSFQGHPWGTESDGGSQLYPRPGDEALAQSLADALPSFTGRPAQVLGSDLFPYDDFRSLPGGLVHSETLYLDNNFDWPVIANGFGSIADGVFTGAATWLQGRGFDCTDRATIGWPSPPSAAELARWRDLGMQNYQTYGAEPVNLVTGNLIEQFDLFTVTGAGDQATDVALTYNALDDRESRLGYGWTFPLGARAQRFSDGSALVVRGDGASYLFRPDGAGFAGEPGTGSVAVGGDGRLTWTDPQGGAWLFATEDGEGIGELVQHTDAHGRTLTLGYGPADAGQAFLPLASATDSAGQQIGFAADGRGRITAITSPDGRTWSLGYDGAGDLATITDPAGGVRSFGYDGAHRMVRLVDPLGVTYLTNEYDGAGRVAVQHDANGNVRTFAYDLVGAEARTIYTDNLGRAHEIWSDGGGRITRMVDPAGGVQRFAFDAAGNQTSFTDEAGVTTAYAYDGAGNLIGKDGPDGARSWTYDGTHTVTSQTIPDGVADQTRTTLLSLTPQGLVASIADPAGGVESRSYDGAGNLTQTISPGGAVAGYAYDGRGNVVAATDANGAVTAIAYDGANRPISVTDPNGNVTTYAWDVLDRLVARADPDGAVTAYAYDGNGNLLAVTAPDGGTTTYTWDGLFHLTSVTDPLGRVTAYEYDAEDNLTAVIDPAGSRTAYAYDGADRVTSMTDPDGGVTAHDYDATGRLIAQTAPGGGVARYTYTPSGAVESVTDPAGGTTGYGYDAADRVVAVVDPLGSATRYAYDALDRIIEVTDPAGKTVSYHYDPDGRATAATDRRGWTTQYAYDPVGNLLSATDPAGAVTVAAYDGVGNVASVTDPLGATTRYGYDGSNRLVSMTDPLGAVTSYGYDPVGRLAAVTDPLGAVTATAYDAAGQVVATTDPTGLVTRYAYDLAGRVADVTDPAGLVTRYAYDGRGNAVSATQNPGPVSGADQNVSWLYAWDSDSNLTSVTDPDGRVTGYSYDPAGRPVGQTLPTGGVSSQSYDAAGRVVSATDPLGRITGYSYDVRGDLVGVDYSGSVVSYDYDAGRNMIAMTDPTGATGWTYDEAGRVTSQLDSGGRWLGYAYDLDGNLAAQQLVSGVDAGRAADLLDQLADDPAGAAASSPDAVLTMAYTYDEASRPAAQSATITPTGSGAGSPRTFAARYLRDAAGRVSELRRTNPDGGAAAATTYAYDAAGRTTAMASITPDVPAAPEAAPMPAAQPDSGQCVTSEATGSVPVPCLSAADYLASRTLPAAKPVVASGQGVRLDYGYANGRVSSMTRTTGVVPAAQAAFDPAAGVSAAQGAGLSSAQVAAGGASRGGALGATVDPPNLAAALPVAGESIEYSYDRLGRVSGASSSTGVTESFGWDAAGNRTAWSTTDDPRTTVAGDSLSATWTLDAAGLPATAAVSAADGQAQVSYGWDAAGSRTSVSVTGSTSLSGLWDQSMSWDAAGRLAGVSTGDGSVSYTYDGLGRRAGSTSTDSTGATTTSTGVFDGLIPLAASTTGDSHGQSTGDDWDVWVRDVLGDRLVESATALIGTSDGQDRWDLVDALGSLIAQGPAAQGAGITQAMGWSAFGVAQTATTGWDEAGGFTGQDTDLTSGLVGFYARFLDPMTGGWASPDAWAGLLQAPATLNRHAYVTGDPVGSIDVLGYFGWGDIVNTAKKAASAVKSAVQTVVRYLDPRNDPSSMWYLGGSSGSSGSSSPGATASAPADPQGDGGGDDEDSGAVKGGNVTLPPNQNSQRHAQTGSCPDAHGCSVFDAAVDLFSYRAWISAANTAFHGDLRQALLEMLGAVPAAVATETPGYTVGAGQHRPGLAGKIKSFGADSVILRVVAKVVFPVSVVATVIDYLWHEPSTPTQVYTNDCYGQWCSFSVDYGISV